MATLRKRKGVYYIRFQEMNEGKRREISRSLETGRREMAEKRKTILEEREELGQDPFSAAFDWDFFPKKSLWTVQECYNHFIETKKKFRKATVNGYKNVIQKWMDTYGLRQKQISTVRAFHFEDFLMRHGTKEEPIKAVTRHSEKRRLSTFWNWCIDTGKVQDDLIGPVELPQKEVEYRSKMITKEEMVKVIQAYRKADRLRREKPSFRPWMSQDWFEAAMWTFFYTGARRSEIGVEKDDDKSGLKGLNIIGLNRKEIEFIYINKAKKNRERYIPAETSLQNALLKYFKKRGWPKLDEYVFLNARGGPVTGRTMYYQFKKYCKDAGVPSTRTIHGIRHKRATKWLENGFTLKEVKDMLGHKSIAMTDELYTHLTPQKLKDKMKRLEDNE